MRALDSAINKTEHAIVASREAIQDLRPHQVPQGDLAQCLRKVGEELAALRAGLLSTPSFRVVVHGESQHLSPEAHEELYRIARELIGNAFNHAEARVIQVEIDYGRSQLSLRLHDDGKGIDPKILAETKRPGHWGLPGVRERAQRIGARLEFRCRGGGGTEVEIFVPAATAYRDPSFLA
jgi:signal transduction histidine kinase